MLALLLGACAGEPMPEALPPTPVAQAEAPSTRIDAEALREDLVHLADDALAGRHTLSPDLQVAADYLTARHEEIGLRPLVGDELQVPFELHVGATATGESALRIHGRRVQDAKAGTFTPLAEGAAGQVRAPAVFVGYAAAAEAVAAEPRAPAKGSETETTGKRTLSTAVAGGEARPAYDDLEGLDLKGKIAVVLLDLPGQPDLRALFARMQEIAAEYTQGATPLIEKGEGGADELAALHARQLEALAKLLRPFMGGQPMPESFFAPPETYEAELDLQGRLGPLMAMANERPGPRFDPRSGFSSQKLDRLEKAGVAGVVFVRGKATTLGDADVVQLPALDEKGGYGPPRPFPVVQLHWKAAEKLVKVQGKPLSKVQAAIDREFAPASAELGLEIEIDAQIAPTTKAVPNVVGVLPGGDLADELVVVGAHYDHIGRDGDGHGMCSAQRRRDAVDEICNGADDNASGSATILALARVLSAAKAAGAGPRRTVVFAHFAGEELGLWGSKALAAREELGSERVVAMINLDMVGRLGRKGLAIGGIGSSPAWMPLLDAIGPHGMKVIYEGAVAGRSDHANFYTAGVPVLFLFTGTHADYHRAGDNSEEINFEGMNTIAELALEIVEGAADGRALPFEPPTEGDGIAPGLPGQNPATVIKTVEAAP